MHPDTYARVALSRAPHIGPKLFRALIEHCGSASEVLRARPQVLCEVDGIAERTAAALADERKNREAEAILEHAERYGIDIICCLDDDYPDRLKALTAAPPILYHSGATDFRNARSLSVVGTRDMSSRGALQIDRILDPLVEYQPLIISGLAYGVDIYTHRRCLQLGLPTLAVMGSGFNHVYPAAHARTAAQLADTGGGVLTAYPYWMQPDKDHFPARNRIVAMLSDLTIVVESARRGGSMITAGMAHDLGRKVGACPGRGGERLTEGCNELIKTGRAHLIEDGTDVVQLLGWKGSAAGQQRRLFEDLDADEQDIVNQLRDRDSVEIDELHYQLKAPPAKLAGCLLMLEMKGVITALPGHRYRLSC
ncbi:DNA-processing protein DprA [Neolewinella lacunae]|uniref:DNA-protecting protein DprA n=1 Tax=Neolewinella lacunae TaxID=1517758 RepID=A0A923T9K3_9BACT|nr:DNA-processing protein DprA [Neolewinella lacunae]MBC6995651.1 DNA-protecting protein DprA [Neolewinella lacunae]MDN3634282.1 DNA-processing protein DprA [Neolewinella lacunae]